MKSLVIATLALGITAAVAQPQGVVIKSSSKDVASGKVDRGMVMYVQGGMARIENVDDRGRVKDFTIFRDSTFWDVDPSSRTFTRMDKATMIQMAQMANARLEQMKTQMASMPPERRAMVQQMINHLEGKDGTDAAESKVEWKDAGQTEHVGQFTCHDWNEMRGDAISTQFCVTAWSAVPAGDQLAITMKRVSAFVQDMMSAAPFPAMTKSLAQKNPMAFAATHGFPVVTRDFEGGKAYTEDVVSSVEPQVIDAGKFEIPKGFKEKSALSEMGNPGGH
ncbi:MAG: hypothetical protein ACRENQ_04840 [Gemmatimonadaceae bacterium]